MYLRRRLTQKEGWWAVTAGLPLAGDSEVSGTCSTSTWLPGAGSEEEASSLWTQRAPAVPPELMYGDGQLRKDRYGRQEVRCSRFQGWEGKEIYQARRCAKRWVKAYYFWFIGEKTDAQGGGDLPKGAQLTGHIQVVDLALSDAWDLAVPLITAASWLGRAASDWGARKPPSTSSPQACEAQGKPGLLLLTWTRVWETAISPVMLSFKGIYELIVFSLHSHWPI